MSSDTFLRIVLAVIFIVMVAVGIKTHQEKEEAGGWYMMDGRWIDADRGR